MTRQGAIFKQTAPPEGSPFGGLWLGPVVAGRRRIRVHTLSRRLLATHRLRHRRPRTQADDVDNGVRVADHIPLPEPVRPLGLLEDG